jgi:hypothetical protein
MDTGFPILCFNISGSLVSCAQNKMWGKLVSSFQCFCAEQIIQSIEHLSKKEAVTFWGNLPQYLNKVQAI